MRGMAGAFRGLSRLRGWAARVFLRPESITLLSSTADMTHGRLHDRRE